MCCQKQQSCSIRKGQQAYYVDNCHVNVNTETYVCLFCLLNSSVLLITTMTPYKLLNFKKIKLSDFPHYKLNKAAPFCKQFMTGTLYI